MENALLKESNHNDADHCIGHKEGGCEEFVGTVLARSSVLTIPRRSALCNYIFLNVYILGLSLSGLRPCPDYPSVDRRLNFAEVITLAEVITFAEVITAIDPTKSH